MQHNRVFDPGGNENVERERIFAYSQKQLILRKIEKFTFIQNCGRQNLFTRFFPSQTINEYSSKDR